MTGPPGPAAGRPDADTDAEDRRRRRVLWALPSGLLVVGSRAGDRRNLMTGNWVQQVATEPRLVAVALESGSVTRALVEEGAAFTVSLLARSQQALVRRFVKPVGDVELGPDGSAVALQGTPVVEPPGAPPRLAAAVAWIDCALRSLVTWDGLGPNPPSHVLAVGEVVGVGETDRLAAAVGPDAGDGAILRMDHTRMHYGG